MIYCLVLMHESWPVSYHFPLSCVQEPCEFLRNPRVQHLILIEVDLFPPRLPQYFRQHFEFLGRREPSACQFEP